MYILCIDASTANFGLAYFKDKKLVRTAKVEIKGKYDLTKARTIYKAFLPYITSDLDLVVFEKPVPMRFVHTVIPINQIIGILFGLCMKEDIPIELIHTKTVAKTMHLVKKGKDKKKEAIGLVQGLYPHQDISTHDIADAVLLGLTYYAGIDVPEGFE